MLQKPTLAIDNVVSERVLYVLLRLAVLFWWGVRRAKCPAETTPLTKARRTVQGTSETAPHDESDGGPLRPTASSPVTSDECRRCSQRLGRALVTRPALSAKERGYRDGGLGMDIYMYHPRYGCCAVAGVHTAQGVQLGIN